MFLLSNYIYFDGVRLNRYTFKAGQIDLTSQWVCSWHERGGRGWSSMQNAIKDHTRLVRLFPHLDQGEAIYIGTDNWQFIQHPPPPHEPPYKHKHAWLLDCVPPHPRGLISTIVHKNTTSAHKIVSCVPPLRYIFGGLVLKSWEKYQLHVWRTRFLWWASSLLWSPLSQLQLLDRLWLLWDCVVV